MSLTVMSDRREYVFPADECVAGYVKFLYYSMSPRPLLHNIYKVNTGISGVFTGRE
jgi:hypothetical protein